MKSSKQLWKELAVEVAAFLLLAAAIVILWRDNLCLFIAMLIGSLAALGLWHDRQDLTFFVVVTVLGTIAEIVFVNFGVWHYANPTFLGVPVWFPLSFGTAVLIGQRIVCTVNEMMEK